MLHNLDPEGIIFYWMCFLSNSLVGQEMFTETLSLWIFQAEMGCNVSAENKLPFTSVTPLALPKPRIKLKPLNMTLLLTIKTKLKNHMDKGAT